MSIKIMKFGGSSVADADKINRVIEIVLKSRQDGDKIVVVVSALGGITDQLIRLADLAKKGDEGYKILLEEICERHDQAVEKLVAPRNRGKLFSAIKKKYSELEGALKKIFSKNSKGGKISPRLLDAVVGFGERLSSRIAAEAIKNRGIACEFVDSRKIIKTDDNFGSANVEIETSYNLISGRFERMGDIFVMGGFIGSTKDGADTTLGRGGSDYTASLVGAALRAAAIEIWTDVDGLMTADPRKIKEAVTIAEISYEEAERMANSGAKVIHPKTMRPAQLKNIPIYIKNTFNPRGRSTKISN